jgi:hypothetical protein
VVRALRFKQQLIVCNAYPGNSPVTVLQNGEHSHTDEGSIRFKECRPLSQHVQAKDKLDFAFANSGIQGTFEVGSLPASDATLLLVVEKRDAASQLMAFHSIAVPAQTDGSTAQLVVVDAYKGNSSAPHLRMEDHIGMKESKAVVSKRVEQLNFNRVYAIEEGMYDASIADHILDDEEDEEQGRRSKALVRLSKGNNYVMVRTGDPRLSDQTLFVYPHEDLRSSASRLVATGVFAAWLSAVLF